MNFDDQECYQCHKGNVVVKILIRTPSKFQSVFLCRRCYKRYNIYLQNEESGYLQDIFRNMLGGNQLSESSGRNFTSEFDRITCPHCLHSFMQVLTSGRFGCLKCLHYFESLLDKVFSSSQKMNFHRGMLPSQNETLYKKYQKLYLLKTLLQESVRAEDYNRAGKIKNHLIKLEKEIEKEANGESKGT